LKRAIRDAELPRGTLKRSLDIHGDVDRNLSGGVPDILESDAKRHRAADRVLEGGVAPVALGDIADRSLIQWNVADADWSWAHVSRRHAVNELPQVAHVSWIISSEQVFAHCVIELRRVALGMQFGEKRMHERDHVGNALSQRWETNDHGRDAVVEVGAERTRSDLAQEIAVARADEPEVRLAPHIASDALVRAFLNGPKKLGLQREGKFADLVEK
jgi:hypothetical protein